MHIYIFIFIDTPIDRLTAAHHTSFTPIKSTATAIEVRPPSAFKKGLALDRLHVLHARVRTLLVHAADCARLTLCKVVTVLQVARCFAAVYVLCQIALQKQFR